MEKFGIFSPSLGIREDFPSVLLPNKYSPDNENTIIRYGEIQRIKGRLKELLDGSLAKNQTPDENPILRYHRLVKRATATEYLFAFTKKHIYQWNSANKEYDERFTCTSDCTEWDTVTYNDKVIATNWVDKVQVADGSGNFAALDSSSGLEYGSGVYLTRAKYVKTFENYIIFGYIEEGGTIYPQRIRWNDLGDEATYDSGDAGSAEVGKGDFLTGFGLYQGFCIMFKEKSYWKMWLVPGSAIFNMVPISTKLGCHAKDSIINDSNGELYFFASDYTIRSIRGEMISRPIDKTLKLIHPDLITAIRGYHIEKFDELWWAIPYGNDATENNKVAVYNNGKWSYNAFAISAFGEYDRQTNYTWATLPYDTWGEWGWDEWDSIEANAGFSIDLGADFSGYTYALHESEQDDTADYTGYAVLNTDLSNKASLNMYKRLLLMQFLVRRETAGTMSIYIQRDNDKVWHSAGSISLAGTTGIEEIIKVNLPCDYRAKSFSLKFSGANRFRLIGIVFGFVYAGER